MNEIEIVESYTLYLKERNVKFFDDGFPKFETEWFASNLPSIIAPFNKRQYYLQKKKEVSICYFSKDEHLYPRLEKVFKEIDLLSDYHSVCMMDISMSPLMLDEVQRINLLLNLLFACVLAVNGIKIIPSFRTGNFETVKLLDRSIGNPKYWVMGSIGTQQFTNNPYYEFLFRTKCMFIVPKTILSYGRTNIKTALCLKDYGIKLKEYKDFRFLSYSKEIYYERL